MTAPLPRKLTVTLEITAIPQQSWYLQNDSWERTAGYRLHFPDKHTTWVDERDYEELYLRNSPTGLLDK
jgi:hypothetical protein